MSKKIVFSIFAASFITFFFLVLKTSTFFGFVETTNMTKTMEFLCVIAFLPFSYIVLLEYLNKNRQDLKNSKYIKMLNNVLITQSQNSLFYEGKVAEVAKTLTKQVVDTIDVDRCSIWLYDKEKESIVCQQLYVKDEYTWYQGIVILKKDFEEYFDHLTMDPIIVANDAKVHPATSCFTEKYLKPLGINSMLDVPIIFKGDVIGVICIESLKRRQWVKAEIDFAQMFSSLYSFAHSVKEGNIKNRQLLEIERFIDYAALVSKADCNGKITYVNKKFTEVSGWALEEVLRKDHHIVNSGKHSRAFWKNMYDVVKDGGIWNEVVTNRAKNGSLYYVDTYIKAEFEESGKMTGFTSIRQDVTDVKRKELEIKNRMMAINKSNSVIEFDLDGNIIFANDLFLKTMGYSKEDIIGKNHKIFITEEYLFSNSKSDDYKDLWKRLRKGEFVSGEFQRVTKSGKKIWLQASYNPIIEEDGRVERIMKISTDITDRIMQSEEIEKKNTYLEHAAKILRHDMHSGINTYIPRGVSSLERRLTEDDIKRLKIEAPLKMIKEGLKHTQKVYKGVYEFTNLVKKDVVLTKTSCNIKTILSDYLSSTSYKSQVHLDDSLPTIDVNESLFCTSIDNLIRNGLKYNDSESKSVRLHSDGEYIYVVDNGRGMSQDDFEYLSRPYVRKQGQLESGSGLGLNICIAILKEHNFSIFSEKLKEGGTELKIKIK